MATYRLVWSGDGALDLSQVLDTRGRPIVLSPNQRAVSVVEEALKNPYVQRYLATPYLKAELLDGPKSVEPTTPLPPPPVLKTAPVEMVATPSVKKEVVVSDDVLTRETFEVKTTSAEPPSPSTSSSPSLDTETETESKGGFKGRKGRK